MSPIDFDCYYLKLDSELPLANLSSSLNSINISEKAASIDILSKATLSLLELLVFSTTFIIIILFIWRMISRRKGLLVMPFDVAPDLGSKYSGKMISDLFTKELQIIEVVHHYMFDPISIKSEMLKIPENTISSEEVPQLDITPKSETFEFGIPDIGTVGSGSTSLSLSNILITFRRIVPIIKPLKVISGNLGIFGSVVKLTACLEERRLLIFETQKKVKIGDSPDVHIPGMVKDIAYQVIYEYEKLDKKTRSISSMTWQGFKHYTDSLEFYRLYTLTGKIEDLERSEKSCIRAAYSERKYVKAVDMLNLLGYVCLREGRYSNAKEIFNHVSKFKPAEGNFGQSIIYYFEKDVELAQFLNSQVPESDKIKKYANYNHAVYLFVQKRWQEALIAFRDCVGSDPQKANYCIGLILYELNDLNESLEAFEKVTKIDDNNDKVWYNMGIILSRLGRWEEAENAFAITRKINPENDDALLREALCVQEEFKKAGENLISSISKLKKESSETKKDKRN